MQVNFTRAFETAWERMVVILFRPFDVSKWFIIGFSAFLAGLMSGGNGVNGSFNSGNFQPDKFQSTANINNTTPQLNLHQLHDKFGQVFSSATTGLVIGIVLLIFIAIVVLTLLLFWLGARGQFMFLDNIVRNRAEIAGPWNFYARQGNSLFGFYLLLALISFLFILPLLGFGALMAWPLFVQSRWPAGNEIVGLVMLGVIYLVVSMASYVVLFIFREFGVPIMFRQRILARDAFFASMRLVGRYPGSIAVFILLRFALFLGLAVVCVVVCCATCCIGTLPYLGTVILLPALIFVRCFTLDCLAQFGLEYDAFMVDAMPAFTGQGIPPNPRPQP